MKTRTLLAAAAGALAITTAGIVTPVHAAASGPPSPQAITCVTVGPIYYGSTLLVPALTVCVPTP